MIIGISGYIGKKKTGIGRVLENILLNVAFIEPQNTFYLFVNYNQKAFTEKKWPPNVKIIKYKISKNLPILNIIWHQLFFQINIKKYKCDISLIPNFSLLIWKNAPTISIIHDLIEFNVKSKFSKIRMIYRHFSVPLMAQNSNKIITVSNTSQNDIIKILGTNNSKIKVIYNGFDNKIFKKYSEAEATKVIEKYTLKYKGYILYVGTIDHPGKNLFSIILAYIKLKKGKHINDKLVIIGQRGHNSKFIFEFINNNEYKNDIIYLGFIVDDELPFFFNGAKIFCFLSLYEGFGLPLIEAMACGCPVLTSNNSALAEVAGSSGVLVNPIDIEEISNKMYELLINNSLREYLIKEGYKRVESFSWAKAATEYLEVFKNFIN